jgi:hypothetical protein
LGHQAKKKGAAIMTTKLKIDLSHGILEVEGSETFVRAIYKDFKAQFVQGEPTEEEAETTTRRRRSRKPRPKAGPQRAEPVVQPVLPIAPVAEPAAALEPVTAIKVPTPAAPSYTRIKDLNLGATAGHPSLGEFMDSKLPITNEERNLVFMYYLQYLLNVETITMDHVYTCYREVRIRAPLNLEHSLRTTVNQKNWITASDADQFTVTHEGKLYVEKQLPKRAKS